MIAVGIDAGVENIKIVILESGRRLSHAIFAQGHETTESATQKALQEATDRARISNDDIKFIVATGDGSGCLSFVDEQATEASCCCRGAARMHLPSDTIIDMGAETCLVVKCQDGKPFNTIRNDRCASGTGRFLKMAAKPLGIDVDEMGRLSLQSHEDLKVNSTCAVFAESEIISLIHLKHRTEDISRAVFRGLARRVYTMIVKVGFNKDLVMIGGFARNAGMVRVIAEVAGCEIFTPEEPLIVGALGAALIAEERGHV